MKVYLDDERPTPDGWRRAYWPDEVIEFLKGGTVTDVSLDHDLGDDERGTGYDVVLWIEEAVAIGEFNPPAIVVHSANLSARQKMTLGIDSIKRLVRQKTDSILRKHAVEGITGWRCIASAAELPTRGMIFVLAAWSTPALVAWRRLTVVMREYPHVDLAVMNIDDAWAGDTLLRLFSPDILGGCGETVWINGGRVTNRLLRFNEGWQSAVRIYTEQLVARGGSS